MSQGLFVSAQLHTENLIWKVEGREEGHSVSETGSWIVIRNIALCSTLQVAVV